MVGPGGREHSPEWDGKRRTIKFTSQVTVDLDTPLVWRYHAFFDERDLDIPVSSWDDWMLEIVIDELHLLFPEWEKRERTYRKIGTTFVDYRSPLTPDEIVLVGVPILDFSSAADLTDQSAENL